jgi:hypothetical protein
MLVSRVNAVQLDFTIVCRERAVHGSKRREREHRVGVEICARVRILDVLACTRMNSDTCVRICAWVCIHMYIPV